MRYELIVLDFGVLAAGRALYPGAAETLEELTDFGATLGVVSDVDEIDVRASLGRAQYLVDAYGCGDTLRGVGAKLQRIARRMAVVRGRMLYVAASRHGLEGAKRLGVDSAAVATAIEPADDPGAARPTHLIAALTELVALNFNRPRLVR